MLVQGRGPVGATPATFMDWGWFTHMAIVIWAIGATAFFGWHVVRHARVCRRLIAAGTDIGTCGTIRVIETDISGPIAFGVRHRYVAVPYDFVTRYDAGERALALAHEFSHHARGDLIVNWIAFAVLACHWFNPVAWAAFRAFRADQEFACDARVLAGRDPALRHRYARTIIKAAGVALSPACNLHSCSNLKGRLTMLARTPISKRRVTIGAAGVATLVAVALAATASNAGTAEPLWSPAEPPAGQQARTIVVKPNGANTFTLIVGGREVAPTASLPGGVTLPADFEAPAGCDLGPKAQPSAMVLKGEAGVETYTVMCATQASKTTRAAIAEGLASLKKVRGMVATQQEPPLAESERRHALGAIEQSIHELEAELDRPR